MLQADNIAYSMSAVRGVDDVVEKVDEVDKDTCHTVVLLNCGATEDLLEKLRLLDDPELEHMQVLVMDSHRPFHLYNVYADGEGKDGEFIEAGDFEKGRVLLIHDPEMDEEGIPDNETMIAANLEEDDEEEDEEELDLDESPVQRRRVGDDGESVAVVGGGDDDRAQRREQKEKREQARNVVYEYYNASSRGPATAMMLMELSNRRVNKLNPATLWWAILGVTEQLVNDDVDENFYDRVMQVLTDEAIALSTVRAGNNELGGSMITTYDEFRFYLLDYWNLYESMFYSNYVAAKLELWKDRSGQNRLHTLLAKAGIPKEQATQKYLHMKDALKNRLTAKLTESEELRQEFKLDKICLQAFRKERKGRTPISATHCVHICNAMLCLRPDEDEKWTDAFNRASDAIWKSANREQEWDDLIAEKGEQNVVQWAIDLRKAVQEKAFSICQDKAFQKLHHFTASSFTAGHDSQILLHPAALTKLALHVLELDRKKYEDRRRASGGSKPIPSSHSRWVLGVENDDDKSVLVVGVHASSELGFKERNRFGKLFRDAVEFGIPEVTVEPVVQAFDSNVVRITHGKFSDFVEYLNTQLTASHVM